MRDDFRRTTLTLQQASGLTEGSGRVGPEGACWEYKVGAAVMRLMQAGRESNHPCWTDEDQVDSCRELQFISVFCEPDSQY